MYILLMWKKCCRDKYKQNDKHKNMSNTDSLTLGMVFYKVNYTFNKVSKFFLTTKK